MSGNYFSDQIDRGKMHGWWLYVVQQEGDDTHSKIGTAAELKYRLSGLQAGNPRKLVFARRWKMTSRADAYDVERSVLLHSSRVPGRDWLAQGPTLTIALAEEAITAAHITPSERVDG